ncbi:MAG: hypothetical protein ACYS32_07580 [Planctomycetota bacterium]|jgi:hypothetical protein
MTSIGLVFLSVWSFLHVDVMQPVGDAVEIREALVQVFEPPGAHGVVGVFAREETNRLVVIGTRVGIDKVRCLLSSAPCEPVPPEGPRIHIIYLEHADAEELADILNSLITAGSGRP